MTRMISARLFALVSCVVIALSAAAAPAAVGTVVRFDTALGNFDVQLYDNVTPNTVANFLTYVNNGDYDGSFFHRLIPGFILQGGGFTFGPDPADPDGGDVVWSIDQYDPVVNEFNISNVRGTIAMAKLDELPDSATNGFFFNLEDNSANLDEQNDGFTVFGHVLGNGMDVVDLLASQEVWNAGGTFSNLPLIDYPNDRAIIREDMEMVNSVTVVTAAEIAGDANGDWKVNLLDLTAVAGHWLTAGASWETGDFNGDDVVNLLDLTALAGNWGYGSEGPIPEPATLAMLGLGGLAMLRRRR